MNLRWQRILRSVLIASLLIFLVLLPGLPILGAYLHVEGLIRQPCGNRSTPLSDTFPDADALVAIKITPEGENFVLDGWMAHGTNGAAIIMLGGAWGGRDNLPDEMRVFYEAGYTVLTFDTRSCAEPPQPVSLGYREIADMQAALAFVLQQPEVNPQKIGVYGHSAGGVTTLLTAARDSRIAAAAVSGTYADLAADIRGDYYQTNLLGQWARWWVEFFYEQRTGIDVSLVSPRGAVAQATPRPLFLIYGSEELRATGGQTLFDAAPEPKTLWIIEGAAHGEYRAVAAQEFPKRLLEFFNQSLFNDNTR